MSNKPVMLSVLAAAAGAGQAQFVAHGHAQVLRQAAANEHVAAGQRKAALHHEAVHVDDAAVGLGLHAQQGHIFVAGAARCKGRAADHGRDGQDAGRRGGQGGHALPLVDRAQALLTRLHQRGHGAVFILAAARAG
jgi:hypothetical protein